MTNYMVIEEEVNLYRETVRMILVEDLEMRKISVKKILIDEQKH